MKTQRKVKSADEVLAGMLVECTGRALCDSGDYYGRHWQANQGMTLEDWRKQPEVVPYYYDGKLEYYTISVFHYLERQLDRNEVCESFDQWQGGDWDGEYYGISARAQTFLNRIGFEATGTVNSYNHESALSQVIQYTTGRIGEGTADSPCQFYVLLQIHGGCDVRGGYTDARLFVIDNEYCYDGGYLNPEDVWATYVPPQVFKDCPGQQTVFGVETTDGSIPLDSMYSGHSLTTTNGTEVEILEAGELAIGLF